MTEPRDLTKTDDAFIVETLADLDVPDAEIVRGGGKPLTHPDVCERAGNQTSGS
jgi:hypothetical protein